MTKAVFLSSFDVISVYNPKCLVNDGIKFTPLTERSIRDKQSNFSHA